MKETKSDNFENKIKSNINGVIEEIADNGNVDLRAIRETLDMQPEKLSGGEFIDIKKESGCDKNEKDISEEMTLAKHSN